MKIAALLAQLADRLTPIAGPLLDRIPARVRVPLFSAIFAVAGVFGIERSNEAATVLAVVAWVIGGLLDALISWRARQVAARHAELVHGLKTSASQSTGLRDVTLALLASASLLACSHWSAGLTYARAEALATGAVEWAEGSGVSTTGDLDCEASATGEVCYRSRCMPLRVSLETIDDGAGLWLCASVGPIVKCERVPQ
jgi:hypothetical protein